MKKLYVTLILGCSLFLTSCKVNWFDVQYEVPWWSVAIPTAVIILTALVIAGKVISSKSYICPKCNKIFSPKWWSAALSLHIGSDRVFKCPHCGRKGFCKIHKDTP